MKFFIKCSEATQICDKNQYQESSFGDKIKLSLHLIFCLICRKYSIRNTKLTRLIKKSKIKTLPIEVKNSLKEKLQSQLDQ